MNEFYVYGYVRLDTNAYFYIGKGKGKRMFKMQGRPEHFLNIIEKIPCVVEIIKDGLSEEDAYNLEAEIIEDLVFNEGYSIDIVGFKRNKGFHLTNRYWGGTGGSGNIPKPQHVIDKAREASKLRVGDKNPQSKKVICLNTLEVFDSMNIAEKESGLSGLHANINKKTRYRGVDKNGNKLVWRYYEEYLTMTEEQINQAISLAQNARKEENNSFYGKHHTEETKQKLREINLGRKQSEETKAKYDRRGEKNHMYGKRGELCPHYGKPKTEECKKKLSEANGTKIRCIELDRTFVSLNEAERILKEEYNIKVNRKTIVNRMKKNKPCGVLQINGKDVELHWEYI